LNRAVIIALHAIKIEEKREEIETGGVIETNEGTETTIEEIEILTAEIIEQVHILILEIKAHILLRKISLDRTRDGLLLVMREMPRSERRRNPRTWLWWRRK
jgi:hypothetical protein